ncbi:PIR protein [Plasmodium vivax]|uniref:VIR protein n=1 Tax=Plasmodium vivax TaxID=5855 RepID=A0A565A4I9_PLAVI|nr:PIR protein [Plasmodium vivax]
MKFVFYPFLNEVSEVYDELNNDEYVDKSRNSYDSLCYSIINTVNGKVEKHKDICMKLMRNLGHLSVNPNEYKLSTYRCNILFHWLYTFLDNDKITYDIIDKCFEDYDEYSSIKKNTTMKCLYFKNEKLNEPTKITLLDIFDNNMTIIMETLMNKEFSISMRGRKYVCECVKIYKDMNETYCQNGEGKEEMYNSTCLKLKNFRQSYEHFYNVQGSLFYKIPSLDNVDSECLDILSSSEQKGLLALPEVGNGIHPNGELLTEDNPDPDDTSTERLNGPLIKGDSSMKKTITTTIGTFAGASSLLAFLYKFTPAGRLVNPKLRTTTGIINNNFYGEETNGMLFDGNEHSQFNSYNIGYEAV